MIASLDTIIKSFVFGVLFNLRLYRTSCNNSILKIYSYSGWQKSGSRPSNPMIQKQKWGDAHDHLSELFWKNYPIKWKMPQMRGYSEKYEISSVDRARCGYRVDCAGCYFLGCLNPLTALFSSLFQKISPPFTQWVLPAVRIAGEYVEFIRKKDPNIKKVYIFRFPIPWPMK